MQQPTKNEQILDKLKAQKEAQESQPAAPKGDRAAKPGGGGVDERSLRDEAAVNFKKVMFGFSPADVMDYIDTQNSNALEAQKVFEEKIEEYKNNIMLLSRERDSFKEKCSTLSERLGQLEEENERIKAVLPNFEQVEAENAALREENAGLQKKAAEANKIIKENLVLKEKASDAEARLAVMEGQQKKYQAEIMSLREVNKKQLYEFTQQQNDVETRCASDRLKIVQMLQVHAYHINQSDSLLKEAQKQFDLAKKTFKNMGMEEK